MTDERSENRKPTAEDIAQGIAVQITRYIQKDVDYFRRCALGLCGNFEYSFLIPLLAAALRSYGEAEIERVMGEANEFIRRDFHRKAVEQADAEGFKRGEQAAILKTAAYDEGYRRGVEEMMNIFDKKVNEL